MICLGNICRSPIAEGVMRAKIEKYGIAAQVDSCGTAGYHIGQSPDHRAIQTLKNYTIDISNLKGRQFQISDFDHFDLIYTMDSNNYSDIIALARNDKDKKKVKLLLNESYPDSQKVVPDPYYGDFKDFEHTYRLVEEACEIIAKRLSK